jgi:hypothetical protein
MLHRVVEALIGQLITDDGFRSDFLREPEAILIGLRERGLDISAIEIAALIATDPGAWTRAAGALDPRLKKMNLSCSSGSV